jgi:hypothetical protein
MVENEENDKVVEDGGSDDWADVEAAEVAEAKEVRFDAENPPPSLVPNSMVSERELPVKKAKMQRIKAGDCLIVKLRRKDWHTAKALRLMVLNAQGKKVKERLVNVLGRAVEALKAQQLKVGEPSAEETEPPQLEGEAQAQDNPTEGGVSSTEEAPEHVNYDRME